LRGGPEEAASLAAQRQGVHRSVVRARNDKVEGRELVGITADDGDGRMRYAREDGLTHVHLRVYLANDAQSVRSHTNVAHDELHI
jgi:hypothetical protein